MKRIEDIEMMEISDLEKVAMDEKVAAPEGLGEDIDALLSSLELSGKILDLSEATSAKSERELEATATFEKGRQSGKTVTMVRQFRPSTWLRVSGIAAAVSLLVGIGLSIAPREKELVDTFDDPALAYAQIEKAMLKIGGGLKDGINSVQKGNECIETPIEIINQSLR